MRRVAELNRAGMVAVAHVAAAQRLPAGDLRVVSARGNLLVHLAPAPVLVRVATLTGWTRPDPAAWLAREVSVARHAADHGGPVVAPTALAEPGPHLVDGLALSLWEYRETLPMRADGRELGTALAALHAAVADHPGPLPWLTPVTDQLAPFRRARDLEGVVWLLGMAHLYPQRYRIPAAERLAEILQRC